jgi:hypothetical protein
MGIKINGVIYEECSITIPLNTLKLPRKLKKKTKKFIKNISNGE